MTLAQPVPLRRALPRRHHLFRVHPHNDAHRVAVRAAATIALPLLTLWLTGHTGWALYATFGAFTALYGRSLPHLARMRQQAGAGIMLALAVTLGAALAAFPGSAWLTVIVVTGYAMLASLAGDRLSWHPAGPIFAVFGVAAVASLPAPASRIPVALGVAAASAAVAVLIGGAGRVWTPARRSSGRRPASASFLAPEHAAAALRYGVAVFASGAAATAAGIGHPYWSMVAAVAAVTGPDTVSRLTRAVHRIAGTLIGVLVAAALLAPHLPVPAIIVIVALLQGGAELLVGRNYGLALVLITPLALMMGELVHPGDPGTVLYQRVTETLLGAAIGVAVIVAVHHLPGHRAASAA